MERTDISFKRNEEPKLGVEAMFRQLALEFSDHQAKGHGAPQIDLCFIDASHTYAGVSQDIRQVWPFCRVLLFHDTLQSAGVRQAWDEVKKRAVGSATGDTTLECHAPVTSPWHKSMPKRLTIRMGIGLYMKGASPEKPA